MSYSRICLIIHVILMHNMRIWLLIFNKWYHAVAFIPLFVVNWFTHAKVRAAVLVATVVLSLLSMKVNIGQYGTYHYYEWHENKDFLGKSNHLIPNMYKKNNLHIFFCVYMYMYLCLFFRLSVFYSLKSQIIFFLARIDPIGQYDQYRSMRGF